VVVDQYDGLMPQTYDQLISLPGIGPYTANAILAFAYNQDAPVMDTNIRRVLIYSFDLPHDMSPKSLVDIARQCVPHGQGRVWNNALMDYGAMVLTPTVTGIKPVSKQ
jgi:A/G-specific adenine glycosylase